jgi:hypothetical protein
LESPGESSSRAGDVDGYVRTVGRERQDLIAAWMSGYFNAARNQSVLNLARFDRNRKAIEHMRIEAKGSQERQAINAGEAAF